jgi:hypothetical protein
VTRTCNAWIPLNGNAWIPLNGFCTCNVLVPAIRKLQQCLVAGVDLRKVCADFARVARDLRRWWVPRETPRVR